MARALHAPSASAKLSFRLEFENRRTLVAWHSLPAGATIPTTPTRNFILTHSQACTVFAAILLGTAAIGAHAAGPNKDDTGLYVGGAIGRSSFSLSSSNSAPCHGAARKAARPARPTSCTAATG
jgi:hypothetical protein